MFIRREMKFINTGGSIGKSCEHIWDRCAPTGSLTVHKDKTAEAIWMMGAKPQRY